MQSCHYYFSQSKGDESCSLTAAARGRGGEMERVSVATTPDYVMAYFHGRPGGWGKEENR